MAIFPFQYYLIKISNFVLRQFLRLRKKEQNLEKFEDLCKKAKDYEKREVYLVALDYINTAMSIDLDHPIKLSEAYYIRGDIRVLMKQYDLGILDLNESIKIDPENPKSFSLRGYAFIHLDKNEDAITTLNSAIALKSESDTDFYNRGLAKYVLSRYSDAIRDFDEAIKLDNQNSKYYFCLLYTSDAADE